MRARRRVGLGLGIPVAIAIVLVAWFAGSAGAFTPSSSPPATHASGPVDHLLVAFKKPVTAGTPFTITVTAVDASGQRVAGYVGSASLTDSSGQLNDGPFAFSNGIAKDTSAAIANPVRQDHITATSGGFSGTSGVFSVIGPLDHIALHPLTPITAGSPFLISAQAMDSAGNVITTDNDPVSITDLSGMLSGAPTHFTNGLARTNSATIAQPFHADQLTISSDGVTAQSPKFNVYGPLSAVVVTGPHKPVAAGSSFTVVARAEDSAGNVLTSYAGGATWSDTTGTLSPSTPSSFSVGVSKTTGATVSTAKTGDVITVTTGGVQGSSAPFDVTSSASPPVAQNQDYSGAVGNTTLGVGTTAAAPAVNISGNLEAGATDPNGLTISTVPASNEATTGGGTVTINSDGTFIYHPPVGLQGTTDTFTFQVADSQAQSAPATATIHISAARVWYVNSAAPGTGSGTSVDPFQAISSVSPVDGSGDFVYVYPGSYTGGFTMKSGETLLGSSQDLVVGGVTLATGSGSNPSLTNAGGTGLTLSSGDTVDGIDIANTAGTGVSGSSIAGATLGSHMTVSGAGGTGLSLSGGSGTFNIGAHITNTTGRQLAITGMQSGSAVNVSGAVDGTGAGISQTSSADALTLSGGINLSTGTSSALVATGGGALTVTGASNILSTTTADALDVENTAIGSSGLTFQSISAGTSSAGPVNGILLSPSTGSAGGLTVTGVSGLAGSGGTIQKATDTTQTADVHEPGDISINNAGPVSLSNMTIQTAARDGIGVVNVPNLTLIDNQINSSGNDGVVYHTRSAAGTFNIASNSLLNTHNSAIYLDLLNSGTFTGHITGNAVGDPNQANPATNGSIGGEGIDLYSNGPGGTVTADVSTNRITGVDQSFGILAAAQDGQSGLAGSPTLNLSLASNNVDLESSLAQDGLTVSSGAENAATVCLNAASNSSVSKGTFAANGLYDADGMSVYNQTNSSTFELVPGSGSYANVGAGNEATDVEATLNTNNPGLAAGPGPQSAPSYAGQEGTAPFTKVASCPTAPAPPSSPQLARTLRLSAPAARPTATRTARRPARRGISAAGVRARTLANEHRLSRTHAAR